MKRITTGRIIADNMIKDGNISTPTSLQGGNLPSVHESMDKLNSSEILNVPVSQSVSRTDPIPTATNIINSDLRENPVNTSGGKINNEHKRIIPQKSMIYYTDSMLDEKIAKPVRDRLLKISQDKKINIVSASLKKMDFGIKNVRFPSYKRGYLAMYKQILGALENSRDDWIFFTEHDVLYSDTHFDFEPKDKETFYYNQNVWYLRPDGHALHYDVNQLSGLCVWRETALIHYRERFKLIEEKYKELVKDGDLTEFNRFIRHMGHEPFTHNRVQWQTQFKYDTWKSEKPNIDIRFGVNVTGMRWNKDQYKNQQLLINWQETDSIIGGWGKTTDLTKLFL